MPAPVATTKVTVEEASGTIDALDRYTFVELTGGVAGAYATKLFADAGADVIVVEPVDGSALRRTTRVGTAGRGLTGRTAWRWLAAGKRSTVGDLADPTIRRLVRSAHMVVADLPTAATARKPGCCLGPSNVVVTISPYGRGPLEDAAGERLHRPGDQRLDRRPGTTG